jgi:hypothetical protein
MGQKPLASSGEEWGRMKNKHPPAMTLGTIRIEIYRPSPTWRHGTSTSFSRSRSSFTFGSSPDSRRVLEKWGDA